MLQATRLRRGPRTSARNGGRNYGPWSEKLVLHVSNDMIGRGRPANSPPVRNLSSSDSIYVTGPKLLSTATELNLQRAAKEFPFIALDRVFEDVSSEFYYPRTDAGPYLERGIPIMQFFNGIHPEYHRATDDLAKLDIEKITNVSKLSFGALWLAADDPHDVLARRNCDLPRPIAGLLDVIQRVVTLIGRV